MDKISRREFFPLTAAAGLGALRTFSNARSTEPHLKFPSKPRERVAVASWPFRAFIESPTNKERNPERPGMDLRDLVITVVRKFDLHNIEPLSDHFRSTDTVFLSQFREALEKAGVRVVNIPVSMRTSFYDPDPEKRKQAVEEGKKWVNIASILASPSIRPNIRQVSRNPPDLDRTAKSLSELAAYGTRKNVVVNLENDNLVSEDAFFIVKVIEKVGSPFLRALADFGNSMLTGDEDFNYRAVAAMFKHAFNICHVKDSEADEKGRVVTVDLGRAFEIAKASGYRGYFSIEFEGQGDPYAGTQKLIDATLRHIST